MTSRHVTIPWEAVDHEITLQAPDLCGHRMVIGAMISDKGIVLELQEPKDAQMVHDVKPLPPLVVSTVKGGLDQT